MGNAYSTHGYSYKHIAAGQATTAVKAKAGTLIAIAYNVAASATNITTIYDDASTAGTIIGIAAVPAQGTVYYGCDFTNGLTIITTTANGADMTVIYI